ncbi:MAG TPA: tetratricopeptide repeat protein [Desulfuromonadales bacterium]|nr:tetratricopeptide repeat protein [Desulfuromonadales bacterium]
MTPNAAAGSLLGKIAGYVEILAKDPRSTVFVSLAESYRQMGLLDDALEVATKGVKALPSFSPGYSILGRIQVQLGNVDAAAAAFERALLIDPENLLSLKGLARVRMQQGGQVEALRLVRRAVALKPDDNVAQKMLAALVSSAATPDLATPLRPVAAVHSHADPISTPTIAEIYIRQGFLGRAMKVYRDLLQADPHNEEIRQKLVELKLRIETQKSAPAATAPADLATTIVEVPVPAVDTAAGSEPGPGETAAAQQLAILTRWLDSISRRRADVR